MNTVQAIAAGIHSLPSTGTAFAATQAAWRFFHNPRITLPDLAAPLQQAGRDLAAASSSPFALVVHDWSKLDYDGHRSKRDLCQLSQPRDIGYELTTALLVDAAAGHPLAPMDVAVRAADGVHTTTDTAVQPPQPHLDQVLPAMQVAAGWGVCKRLVHVIDREGDSVQHLRAWADAGHLFVARGDDRIVTHDGRKRKLSAIAADLAGALDAATPRAIEVRGQQAWQHVAEAAVVLSEPGWERLADGKKQRVRGTALPLRLIVTQVRDARGAVLAEWWLLTNVSEVAAEVIAQWYYWRWRIESFHKLLKSAGLEVEEWQQETAGAITRRLLVGCMACVTVWRLGAAEGPAARACRRFLMRLSGRQLKRGVEATAPGLLAGLHLLLAMLDVLEQYRLEELYEFARIALPHPRPPNGSDV
ncbi:MAG: IS4 family transposase [Gemmataceae bacterium]